MLRAISAHGRRHPARHGRTAARSLGHRGVAGTPTTGEHLYGAFTNTNGSAVVGVIYRDTPSDFVPGGPDSVATNFQTFDPFLLPYQNGNQVLDTSTLTDFPHNSQQLLLASTSSTQIQGFGFYLTEDANGVATINSFTFNEAMTGLNNPITLSQPQAVETGLIGSDLTFNASDNRQFQRVIDWYWRHSRSRLVAIRRRGADLHG